MPKAPASPSREVAFASSKLWLRALHYSDFESRIDSKNFFLASKNDPLEELQASIQAINLLQKVHGREFACAFPYRFRLIKNAGLVADEQPACDELAFFKKEFGTDGLQLVFVSQYADDPSSILGHLFFRFTNKVRKASGAPVEFLYKTLNFAAGVAADENMFSYVYNGIFGGFQGTYTIYQYATMVEKYNNIESRNLYLYDLKLNPLQIEQLIEHVWELTQYSSQDYFFFDENCAFQLLAILETLFPGKKLTASLPFYVAPIDVIKVVEANDLVKNVEYIPSLYQNILHSLEAMPSNERDVFDTFLDGELKAKDIQSTLVIETLISTYNFMKHEQSGVTDGKQKGAMSDLLLERSKKGISPPVIHQTPISYPHLSHASTRMAMGLGMQDNSKYGELTIRPAIHDIMSRSEGYQRNSSISLLNLSLRVQQSNPELSISKVTLINLAKLNGTKVYRRVAWYVDLSLKNTTKTCIACLQADFDISFGYSTDLLTNSFDFFTLITSIFKENEFSSYWGPGLGPTLGFMWTPSANIRLFSKATTTVHSGGKKFYQWEFGTTADLTEALDFRVSAKKEATSEAPQRTLLQTQFGYSF